MNTFEQDGADFYDATTGALLARIPEPFVRRNDWYSLEAAKEARVQFMREHPEYVESPNP